VSGKPHERLEAWKSAMELVESIYRVTASFPTHEQFGLVSQMRRAAVSVPSNLAEGAARDGSPEFARFLSIARGSLSELDTQFQIAIRLGYVKPNQNQVEPLLERTSKLISGLHRKAKETE
jgi:four helix bundle protein